MLNPNIDLKSFIAQNHSFMTVIDIIEETGASYATVSRLFKELQLEPIGKRDQLALLMQDNSLKLTMKEFAEKFGYRDDYIRDLVRERGITFLEIPLPKIVNEGPVSISERLATVKTAGEYIPWISSRGLTSSSVLNRPREE